MLFFWLTTIYINKNSHAHTAHAHTRTHKTIKLNFNHLSNFVCRCCPLHVGEVFAQARSRLLSYTQRQPKFRTATVRKYRQIYVENIASKLCVLCTIAKNSRSIGQLFYGQDERDYHAPNQQNLLKKEIKKTVANEMESFQSRGS